MALLSLFNIFSLLLCLDGLYNYNFATPLALYALAGSGALWLVNTLVSRFSAAIPFAPKLLFAWFDFAVWAISTTAFFFAALYFLYTALALFADGGNVYLFTMLVSLALLASLAASKLSKKAKSLFPVAPCRDFTAAPVKDSDPATTTHPTIPADREL